MNSFPPDFIGLGAQRAGTSWIYACLYEHPEICIPVKEIHFFSRERNWTKGNQWYRNHFKRCQSPAKKGEFSTSYLFDEKTPERIHHHYPEVKVIASLRNPIDRAFSNYKNDIMAGRISPDTPFKQAFKEHPEYLNQGLYAAQLRRYLAFFPSDQILIMVYEDSARNPLDFIHSIYKFLGVDNHYKPTMLTARINIGRAPKHTWLEIAMNKFAANLRRIGLHEFVWQVKKTGLPVWLRTFNTQPEKNVSQELAEEEREELNHVFERDIEEVAKILGRDLEEWRS